MLNGNAERTKYNISYLTFISSEDNSKLMILETNRKNMYAKTNYEVIVLDNDLTEVWSKSFTLRNKGTYFEYSDSFLANDGTVYFVGREYRAKNNSDNSEKFNGLNVKRIFDKDSIISYDLDLLDQRLDINDIKLTNNFDGKGLRVIYFKQQQDYLKELVGYELDENLNMTDKISNSFSFNDYIFNDDDEKKNKPKKRKNILSEEQKRLKIRHLKKLRNNECIIIAEQFSQTDIDPKYGGGKFYYGDIIALKLNDKNKLVWAKKIPKNQISGGSDHLGIAVYAGDDFHYIIFNDDEKNVTKNTGNLYTYTGGYGESGVFKAVRLDNDLGEMTESIIFKLKNENIVGEPKEYFTAPNEIICLGYKGKDHCVIKIAFKD